MGHGTVHYRYLIHLVCIATASMVLEPLLAYIFIAVQSAIAQQHTTQIETTTTVSLIPCGGNSLGIFSLFSKNFGRPEGFTLLCKPSKNGQINPYMATCGQEQLQHSPNKQTKQQHTNNKPSSFFFIISVSPGLQ